MAFSSLIITDIGKNMIAAAVPEGGLKFTKIQTTSHVYDGSQLETLETLADVQQEVDIDDVEKGESCIKVAATLDNTGVKKEYVLRMYGIYASLQGAAEKLVGVSVDPTPLTVPTETDVVFGVTLASTILFANTDAARIEVDPTAWATRHQVEKLKATHIRIPAFDIPVSAWSEQLEYRVESPYIKTDSICDVFFSNSCRAMAADADIVGDTVQGALILHCTEKPVGTLYIDLIEVRNEVS